MKQLSLFDTDQPAPRAAGGSIRSLRKVEAMQAENPDLLPSECFAPAPAEAKAWARAARRVALAAWASGRPAGPAVKDARRRALAALGGKVSI
jgi:hypothetical protein